MPINYKEYPPNWKTEIRPRILERAHHCCERCGVANHAYGYRTAEGEFIQDGTERYIEYLYGASEEPGRDFKIVLTVAHLDGDRTNNDDANLMALCQKCHLQHDRPSSIAKARTTRRRKAHSAARAALTNAGQTEMEGI